jgi:hypothetical protein
MPEPTSTPDIVAGPADPITPPHADWGVCSFGGDHPAERRWNGQPICWPHWNRAKLAAPVARHWLEAVEAFRSGVDLYDIMTYWPACGLDKEDIHGLSVVLDKIEQHSREVLGLPEPEATPSA